MSVSKGTIVLKTKTNHAHERAKEYFTKILQQKKTPKTGVMTTSSQLFKKMWFLEKKIEIAIRYIQEIGLLEYNKFTVSSGTKFINNLQEISKGLRRGFTCSLHFSFRVVSCPKFLIGIISYPTFPWTNNINIYITINMT